MGKIKYYFIEEHNKKNNYNGLMGKGGHYIYSQSDWWDIKEYGYLDISKAKTIATRYNKSRDYATYNTKELYITFDTIEDKQEFIKKFIKPYESEKTLKRIMEGE